MTPKILADKIISAILKTDPAKQVTYDMIAARYANNVQFNNAMILVHKSKNITVKNIQGVLIYTIPVEKAVIPNQYTETLNATYPRPKLCTICNGTLCAQCFPFYDPSQDTIAKIKERLYMTRDEYKAAVAGKTFIPRKKPYQYAKK